MWLPSTSSTLPKDSQKTRQGGPPSQRLVALPNVPQRLLQSRHVPHGRDDQSPLPRAPHAMRDGACAHLGVRMGRNPNMTSWNPWRIHGKWYVNTYSILFFFGGGDWFLLTHGSYWLQQCDKRLSYPFTILYTTNTPSWWSKVSNDRNKRVSCARYSFNTETTTGRLQVWENSRYASKSSITPTKMSPAHLVFRFFLLTTVEKWNAKVPKFCCKDGAASAVFLE